MNWLWHLRYWFYRTRGSLHRLVGLAHPESTTLEEVMSGLERDPEMRKLLDEARAKLGMETRP